MHLRYVCCVCVLQELVVETIDRQGNTRPRFLMYDIMQLEVSVTKNRTDHERDFTFRLCSAVCMASTYNISLQCVRVCLCV